MVVNAAPFQLITEEETKLLPFAVKVNDEAPAVTLDGEMDVNTGTGLVTVLLGIATFLDNAGELEQIIFPEYVPSVVVDAILTYIVVFATAPLFPGDKVILPAKPEVPPEAEEISNPAGAVIVKLFTRLLAETTKEEFEDAVPDTVLNADIEPVVVMDEHELSGASADEIAIAVVPDVVLTVLTLPVAHTPLDEIAQPTILPEAASICSILLTPVERLFGIAAFQAPALVE